MAQSSNDIYAAATLAQWGEFRLINEIILPTLAAVGPDKALGDDCAFLPNCLNAGEELVVTSDVGPRPLTWMLGRTYYRSWGWYSVVVNLSDLASAGSRVVAFCSSVDAPSDMRVSDFKEFFCGIAEACKAFGAINVGGNIRAAAKFACHGMAIGAVPSGARLGRTGCSPGDIIVAVGECGQFMSTFLRARSIVDIRAEELPPADLSRLTAPVPRVKEMRQLSVAGVISAATDNSDGVLGSLWNIAERSKCGFELDFDESAIAAEVRAASKEFGINLWNLALCWGDWQVIATVRNADFDKFIQVAALERIPYTVLGRAIPGPPFLQTTQQGKRKKVNLIRNENFSDLSFNADLQKHLDYMLRSPIVED